ncbi:MAG TPA: hypothetical protein VGV89_07740 [Thermoplasmata archaeon]|nr:hypothetical protein [Thermoplasmata archaeon]
MPRPGLFSAAIESPDLYPDDRSVHGYYVPVPPPPPFKIARGDSPILVGEHGGRQWTVQAMVTGRPGTRYSVELSARTYCRFTRSEELPFGELPWVVAAFPRSSDQRPGTRGRTPFSPYQFNLAGVIGQRAIRTAGILLGRTPIAAPHSPVAGSFILESWDPGVREGVGTDPFVGIFAKWERRSLRGDSGWSGAQPVVHLLADRLSLDTGLEPRVPVREHARTVREFLEFVPALELATTGRDPVADPIPHVDLMGPDGSVPDRRPAYRCPGCGQLEILKTQADRVSGLVRRRTLRCSVDIFPPQPLRPTGTSDLGGPGTAVD